MSPTELKTILSKNIKKFRKQKGFSQFALAEKADVSEDTIKSIELMRQWPSEKTLCQIVNALEIEIYSLFIPDSSDFQKETKKMNELKKLIAKNILDYVGEVLNEI